MDAKSLSQGKGMLKKRVSVDRSAPLVEDAAHPGSAGVLRAISVGHFELKQPEGVRDASAPALEEGTGFHTDIRPAVFAEVQTVKKADLKTVKTNDRSEPVVDKWVHIDTNAKPPSKAIVDEIKEKRASINALASYNQNKGKEEIEKYTRPELMSELKSYKEYIDEKADWNNKNSKQSMSAKVNTSVVEELKQKRQSISEFTAYAAANQSTETYRAQSNPSLVSEIKQKRASIDALTKMHVQNSGTINVS